MKFYIILYFIWNICIYICFEIDSNWFEICTQSNKSILAAFKIFILHILETKNSIIIFTNLGKKQNYHFMTLHCKIIEENVCIFVAMTITGYVSITGYFTEYLKLKHSLKHE